MLMSSNGFAFAKARGMLVFFFLPREAVLSSSFIPKDKSLRFLGSCFAFLGWWFCHQSFGFAN